MSNLSSFLKKSGVTQSAFAQRVGVVQATISRLARGTVMPSIEVAVKIERETGGEVPANSWAERAARCARQGRSKSPEDFA
jgi:transcriptional regulator with XRE-family HTH domain